MKQIQRMGAPGYIALAIGMALLGAMALLLRRDYPLSSASVAIAVALVLLGLGLSWRSRNKRRRKASSHHMRI